jgi:hypothetical protein
MTLHAIMMFTKKTFFSNKQKELIKAHFPSFNTLNVLFKFLFRERLAAGETAATAAGEAYSCQLSNLHSQLTGLHGIRYTLFSITVFFY